LRDFVAAVEVVRYGPYGLEMAHLRRSALVCSCGGERTFISFAIRYSLCGFRFNPDRYSDLKPDGIPE
jgi:hypothetical protein